MRRASTSQGLLLDLVKIYKYTLSPRTSFKRQRCKGKWWSEQPDRQPLETFCYPDMGSDLLYYVPWELAFMVRSGCKSLLKWYHLCPVWTKKWIKVRITGISPHQGSDCHPALCSRNSPVQCSCDPLLFPLPHTFEQIGTWERLRHKSVCRYCFWTLFLNQTLPGYLKFYSNFGS